MRRRFGRGRRGKGAGESRGAPIDAARSFERILESGAIFAKSLEPVSVEDVPPSFAALGVGETEDGTRLALGFAPRHGGDAALAVLALAQRLAGEEGFAGEAVAVAPQWSAASRRRLGLLGPTPYRFRAVAASSLAEGVATVEPEPPDDSAVIPLDVAAAHIESVADPDLFRRALAAFEGLAAKHGGAVRAAADRVELVLLARRVALLRAEGAGVVLDTLLPERSSARLTRDGFATAMDQLEGQLRKRLNDRRVRGSEEGQRAGLLDAVVAAGGLRGSVIWPLAGSDPEVLDLVGLAEDGRAVVAVVRDRMTLPGLGGVLDALARLRPSLPLLFARGTALRPGPPRLMLAANEYDDSVLRAAASLALECSAFDVRTGRGREPGLERRGLAAGAVGARPAVTRPEPERAPAREAEPEPPPPAERPRREEGRAEPAPGPARFDEVSLFDLEEERAASEDGAGEGPPRRPRRGRGRRRGRRGRGSAAGEASAERGPREAPGGEAARERDAERPPRTPPRERRTQEELDEDTLLARDDVEDLSEALTPLDEEVPDVVEEPESAYDDEEDEELAEEADGEQSLRDERERRRRARLAKADPPAPEPTPRPVRRRAAIVAHADRASVLAAIVLARDVRMVEGFWVYSQSDLMTFFRSVATDLREDSVIHVVGFTASPARDTLQAAALYRGRLSWFDHHDWPPEDLESLRQAIGSEEVYVHPGAESPMAAVLAQRTRRSRFSDKLVELATGRFSQHDYERWGRVWWQRADELTRSAGERRSRVDPLLVGRPSDLAREAARTPTPPPPDELAYVAERDFRVVHFGGYTLVVVPVPRDRDLHLAARIARERYAAELSVAYPEGGNLVVLGGEESRGRHGLDLVGMVAHLDSKHEWIEALPDDDHVARMRVRGLPHETSRLDEIIGEIAMGRSILEG